MFFDFNLSIIPLSLLVLLLVVTLFVIIFYRKRIKIVADHRSELETRAVDIDPKAMSPVSVVVYARDNSARLERLLDDVLVQEYDAGYEVIVVNDGGGHDVSDLVIRRSQQFPNLKLTFVPDNAHNLSRRKLAITLGIKAARYDFILLLAAECRLPDARWLRMMARHFAEGCDVVLGVSLIKADGEEALPAVNRMGLLHDTVAWCSEAAKGAPYRGSRYNMGYSKNLFFEHKGFARTLNIHDGDDDLFITEIAPGNKVMLELGDSSIVDVCTTLPSHLYSEIKKRHAFTGRLSGENHATLINRAPMLLWLSLFIAIGATVAGLPNLLAPTVALLLLIAQWTVVSVTWAKCAAAVGMPVSAWKVVPGLLRMPFHNLRYSLSSRKDTHLNYTWHHKRL